MNAIMPILKEPKKCFNETRQRVTPKVPPTTIVRLGTLTKTPAPSPNKIETMMTAKAPKMPISVAISTTAYLVGGRVSSAIRKDRDCPVRLFWRTIRYQLIVQIIYRQKSLKSLRRRALSKMHNGAFWRR